MSNRGHGSSEAHLPPAVMPTAGPVPVTVEDLPPEAQALLGEDCECGLCRQPICPPNPNVTCQVAKVDKGVAPPYIANARKGDLVLCPGDGSGVIGSLLGALRPPQVYTHMGIMVADQNRVRHATAIDDRMQAYPVGHLFGLADVPAPLDGFEQDKVRFGWPGTITQTVEEAYKASKDPNYAKAKYSDRASPTSDQAWSVNALGFDSVYAADGVRRPALIVSPCLAMERQYPQLRDVVIRVADEVLAIRGHYRFFAYSNAAIAFDSAFAGPPIPLFDPDGHPIEDTMPDPNDPCKSVPTSETIPVVCSTLIWVAVQRLKQKGLAILLDDDTDGEPPIPPDCVKLVPPNWAGDAPDPKNMTPDGLYYFTVGQRKAAGKALYETLHKKVDDSVAQKINKVYDALDELVGFHVPRVALATLLWAITSGAGAVATLLGITALDAKAVVDFFTDMPDDIANQICNSFASDNQGGADEESSAWQEPGDGRSVSPDDIVWFWDPTSVVGLRSSGAVSRVIGLYGENRELALRPSMWGDVVQCHWALSPGPAKIHGIVTLEGTHVHVVGASVSCACRHTMTNSDGFYEMDVPAGTYWAKLSWQDPVTGIVWTAEGVVKIPFASNPDYDFVLKPPPVDWRQVEIHGKMDIVDTVLVGHDIWAHPVFNDTARMGPFGNPADPSDKSGKTYEHTFTASCGDETSVELTVKLFWKLGGFIDGTIGVLLKDGSDVDDTAGYVFSMKPGDVISIPPIDLDSGEVAPDRAHIEITIENKQQL